MFSKKTIAIFVLILISAAFFSIRAVQNYKDGYDRIGILKAIDHPALDATAEGIKKALSEKLGSYQILYESAQSDSALAQQIVQKFLQQKVKAIVTIGTTVTQVAMQKTKNTPIVFASVTDPIGSGIVQNVNVPEGNVTGISNFAPDITQKQLIFFKELLPNLKKLGIIYNSGESNSITLVNKIKIESAKLNINVKEIVVQNTNDAVFAVKSLLSAGVDAIFIDNDNTALGAIKGIVNSAMKSKVPVFCSDTDTIKHGVLAAVGPDQFKLGEKVGEMVIKIVKENQSIDQISVLYGGDIEYVVNENTAKELNINIPSNTNIRLFNHKESNS